MKLTCTDQGEHPERVLGWLNSEIRGGHRAAVLTPWVPRRQLADERDKQAGTLQAPPCPTCRRTVPMRQETALRLLDTLDADTLDISRIR